MVKLKVMLIFNVFLASVFPITTGGKLPNKSKGWLLHRTVDVRYLTQLRDDSSVSKEVHEGKLTVENTPRSTSLAYYAQNMFRLTHRSAKTKLPIQELKVRVFSILI